MSEIVVENPVVQVTPAVNGSPRFQRKWQHEDSPEADEIDCRGVYFEELPDGAILEVETKHHRYVLVKTANGRALVSGHPVLCPGPVSVEIEGSVSAGTAVKIGFIGPGMHLKFQHPTFRSITTSRILNIRRR